MFIEAFIGFHGLYTGMEAKVPGFAVSQTFCEGGLIVFRI